MKKLLLMLLPVLGLFLLFGNLNVHAEESANLEKELNELIEKGYISEEVTLQDYEIAKEEEAEGISWIEQESLRFEAEQRNSFSTMSTSKMQAGDIIITNGTSFSGLTGHAGIAISHTQILSIAGPGSKPSVHTISDWKSRYQKTGSGNWSRVYRVSNPIDATTAYPWAKKTYQNSNAGYNITPNYWGTKDTYCSKIVWQAYRYGAGIHTVTVPNGLIVLPYSLPNYFNSGMGIRQVSSL